MTDETLEPSVPSRRGRPWLLFGVGAVVATGLAATAWAMVGTGPSDSLAGRWPAGGTFYAEVDVEALSSDEAEEVASAFGPLYEALTGEEFDPEALVEEGLAAFDEGLTAEGFSYAEDIEPWLAGPVAVGMFPGSDEAGLAVVGGDDADALDATLAKAEEEAAGELVPVDVGGTEFLRGLDDDGTVLLVGRLGTDLVLGTDEGAVEAFIEPTDGETLLTDPEVGPLLDELAPDRIVTLAVDLEAAAEMGGALSPLGMEGAEPPATGWATASAGVDDGNVRFDFAAGLGEDHEVSFGDTETVLANLPADAFAYLRMGNALSELDSALSDQVPPEMEMQVGMLGPVLALFEVDGAVAVWPAEGGDLPVGGALVGVGESDAGEVVDGLAGLLAMMAGVEPEPVEGGYEVDGQFSIGGRGPLFILTTDPQLLTAPPGETLADGDLYRRARDLVGPGEVTLAIDVDAAMTLLDDSDELACNPVRFVAGTSSAGEGRAGGTVILEIEQPEGC